MRLVILAFFVELDQFTSFLEGFCAQVARRLKSLVLLVLDLTIAVLELFVLHSGRPKRALPVTWLKIIVRKSSNTSSPADLCLE